MKKLSPLIIFALLFAMACTNSKTAADYYNEGIELGNQGKYEQSLEAFTKAVEKDPNYADAYNNRGFYAKMELGDYKGAIEDFNKAIELGPKAKAAYSLANRGYAYFMLKDFPNAMKDFKASQKINPNNAYLYRYMAELMFTVNNPDAACVYAQRAIDLGYEVEYKKDDLRKMMDEHCPAK
jgi:tetratricopeptide (TPR) repeat protein